MNILSITQVTRSFGLQPVLDKVSLAINLGERVAIIGANGSGKTTLFNMISGEVEPDSGVVSLRRGISVGVLPQEPQFDPTATIHDTLAASLVEIQQVIADYQAITEQMAATTNETEFLKLQAAHDEIEHRLEHLGGWQYQHRLDMLRGYLDIPDDQKRMGELSGGERKRVALACAFLRNPDLLVLDEPTNHLDATTISWLEQYLDTYPGSLLLITHDRYFLDNIVDRMVELSGGKAIGYKGGYSDYLMARAETEAQEARSHAKLLNLLRREEAWLRRGVRARGTKSKHRINSVLELREQARREAELNLSAHYAIQKDLGNTILETRQVTVQIEGRTLVNKLDFILKKGERVALLGPNGCGKTSLLKVLLKQAEPASGEVIHGKNTRIAYFSQDRDEMETPDTIWKFISENAEFVKVNGEFRNVRSYLSDFKFANERLDVPVCSLSGGEKTRLKLAKLLLLEANLLVLDEPTNDLDIDTMQWVEELLNSFAGCVLFVTHDRFFLDKVATSMLVFEGNGEVVNHAGNYSLYTQLKSLQEEDKAKSQKAEAQAANPQPKKTPKPGLSYKEKLELAALEKEIATLEQKKVEIETKLSQPAEFGIESNYQLLSDLTDELTSVNQDLETSLERWMELEEKRQQAG